MPVTHFPISVPDAATYTVDPDNAGLVHYMPDLTATCTITLPTPQTGLWFEFAYIGAAADAQNWIISTGSNTNYYKGGVIHMDSDAGAGTDELVPVRSNGSSNAKLTVVTPDVGTRIRIECADGTRWNLVGHVVSTTIPTIADLP
ncbi:hypothetical protein JQ617_06985 [Bradyrhizobium sp. KB893862 SZCCT0404]|uniref:hypothetical protein n=1 Tax=Bradyrhizobium sp. KB893862 SZCCT0404 TaxID=2807672 RepID=UPI001BAA860D|nr:hypothetical protein [Bradyrhizobium sp. KB893862 SZCCT0404]MBR1173695.1 hypothetical protein [Bradyrhizobium sp. KB893862 SZCCT0404]